MHATALRCLVMVAECLSIREAAERLHISPSAVSRQIQKVEDRLGTRLFDRDKNGTHLTEAGRLAVQHAKETLSGYERLHGDIRNLSGMVSGLVSIATLNSLTVKFLPELISSVADQHMEVTFRVVACDPMEVSQQVASCSVDFGLTFNAVEAKGIKVLKNMPCPFVVIMRPDHPLASEKSLTLDQCSGQRLIYQENSGPMRLFLGEDLEKFQHLHLPVLTSNSLTLLKNLLLRGTGLAFYTRLAFAEELSEGKLVAVPLVCERADSINLNLITSPHAMPTAATRLVSRTLKQALEQLSIDFGNK
ncbi:MAG: LysR family transcriptional regulator [Paracoccaceae bacterium]|nr:LysR family transcriptional regulator [Paracoccaceae bacterium]MDE2674803.1 LysR family transcriptional regulator [Paracoccaceae bacterium]MDE2738985.1 LysR family transcriptional regulator [Paracoccaceae bacterium]MXZ50489.1 LysR family transcriptional regulator [Paracoccaceae bacterium]MYF47225.1 LysR family transcriptional regulator [Paracoccaceae bacterium]